MLREAKITHCLHHKSKSIRRSKGLTWFKHFLVCHLVWQKDYFQEEIPPTANNKGCFWGHAHRTDSHCQEELIRITWNFENKVFPVNFMKCLGFIQVTHISWAVTLQPDSRTWHHWGCFKQAPVCQDWLEFAQYHMVSQRPRVSPSSLSPLSWLNDVLSWRSISSILLQMISNEQWSAGETSHLCL